MSAYLAAVVADAPVHYWRCADPGGSLFHDFGSSPRALESGLSGALQLPYLGPVTDGGAAVFDLNANASYGDSDLALPTPFTLECWVWIVKSAALAQGFVSVSNGTTACELGIDTTLHPHAFTLIGPLTAAAPLNRNTWHHLALTITLAASVLYVDGVNVAAAGSAVVAFSPNLVIGSGGTAGGPTRFAHAAISEAAIYGTALSAARVAAHAAAADNTASRPVFNANGIFNITSTGQALADSAQITTIVEGVDRTFSNAP